MPINRWPLIKKIGNIAIWPQRVCTKNQALSLLYPFCALTSCQKLEKIDGDIIDHGQTN